MGLLMDMENISGQMAVCTKVILNMESDMDMEYGLIDKKHKYIQDVIEWIRNRVLVCMNGLENKHIVVNLNKTIDKVLVGCMSSTQNYHHNPLKIVL